MASTVCAVLQGLAEALQKYAVDILPVVIGDPGPPADTYAGQPLNDGVLSIAFQALQAALEHGSVPVRRQWRVMSWLCCLATGVTSTVDGATAEATGPRLFKQGAKASAAIAALEKGLS